MRVFDFDNTIYDGESAVDFFLFSIKKNPAVTKYVPVVLYNLIKYKLGKTTMQDLETGFKKYAHKYITSFDDPEGLVRDFWDCHMHKIKKWYIPQEDDVIVTASFDVIIEEACKRLGVKNSICSIIDRKTMEVTYINFNHNKKERFYELFGTDTVIDEFYTDNDFDKPMMQIANKSFLVKKNKIKQL